MNGDTIDKLYLLQLKMHQHMMYCFEQELSCLPIAEEEVKRCRAKQSLIRVHCICGLPEYFDEQHWWSMKPAEVGSTIGGLDLNRTQKCGHVLLAQINLYSLCLTFLLDFTTNGQGVIPLHSLLLLFHYLHISKHC